MLKSQITQTNIDREVVIENDSDFLKKVEQQVQFWNLGQQKRDRRGSWETKAFAVERRGESIGQYDKDIWHSAHQ